MREELLLEPSGRLTTAPPPSTDPFLLLLHGTFSHTEGAFAELRATSEWERIVRRYPGRVLALEHDTLGRTPAENALEAALLLPEGAVLHLVTHSRGGLVGEALSYAARHSPDLRAYAGVDDHPDVTALPELHGVLLERHITVKRFARVACPARGTTSLSHRLDRVASLLFNVFKLVPVLPETGIAEFVKKFLLVMLEQRSDPRVIPGLEAQIPESLLLRCCSRQARSTMGSFHHGRHRRKWSRSKAAGLRRRSVLPRGSRPGSCDGFHVRGSGPRGGPKRVLQGS